MAVKWPQLSTLSIPVITLALVMGLPEDGSTGCLANGGVMAAVGHFIPVITLGLVMAGYLKKVPLGASPMVVQWRVT